MVKNKKFYQFLRQQLNFRPRNLRLYELAFLHRSASHVMPDGNVVNNERLEFLGDAVIDAVVADYLFRKFPKEDEGFLTRLRSKIVNRSHLDSIANNMGLSQVVTSYVSNPETLKKRICGEVFEALMGAMYLDKGYGKTHKYITNHVMKNYIDLKQLTQTETDFKSRLIEWCQKHRLQFEFQTFEEFRDKKDNSLRFSVQLSISDVPVAKGTGTSKKEAEQMASQKTLDLISSSPDFSTNAFVQYLKKKK